MRAFDSAVRALALREGHEVTPRTLVEVEMKEACSGYSEYTLTNVWDTFTMKCGTFERTYENEQENRDWDPKEPVGPQTAMAKLFDELATLDEVVVK